MSPDRVPVLILLVCVSTHVFTVQSGVGVNWGTTASHPLPPPIVVDLLKSNGIDKVRIFDADPPVLQALSGSNIKVTLGIPDLMLQALNMSVKAAESWIHDNVTRYVNGGVHILYIAVGENPFLQDYGEQFHTFVVGAATNIQIALSKAKLASEIKVVVPCSFDAFSSKSGLPSRGLFRSDINTTMVHLLSFLSRYHAPFLVDVSPFQSIIQNKNLSLDLALFKESARPLNDSHRIYKNIFDITYDVLVAALTAAGSPRIDIVIGMIGWPTDGSTYANSSVAETFMKGLMEHLRSKKGTPLRTGNPPVETFILSLLDEDQGSIASGDFERHWGVFTFDGLAKYQVDLGQGSRNLVNAQNVDYMPSKWCVVNNNKDLCNASLSAENACASADCTALSPGGSCSNISWPANVSYAFNSFFQKHDQLADSCDFGGLGLITTVDPSLDDCRFYIEIQTSRAASLAMSGLFDWMILLTITISAFFSSNLHGSRQY
uniref:X8 domain-containing protein n=1 Tax=Kalanchoe fedtschenkoi TaxID=63787 RepID=A0A7N0RDW7_KALFE